LIANNQPTIDNRIPIRFELFFQGIFPQTNSYLASF